MLEVQLTKEATHEWLVLHAHHFQNARENLKDTAGPPVPIVDMDGEKMDCYGKKGKTFLLPFSLQSLSCANLKIHLNEGTFAIIYNIAIMIKVLYTVSFMCILMCVQWYMQG